MAIGGSVFLCFGRELCFTRAERQLSSTVASFNCTESPSCIFSISAWRLTLHREQRLFSQSPLCVSLASMGFFVHLFTFKNKTKQNRVPIFSPHWPGICSPPASASQALQSHRSAPPHAQLISFSLLGLKEFSLAPC